MKNKRILVNLVLDGRENDNFPLKIDETLLSCWFGAFDRGDILDVTDFGIYENNGEICFVDKSAIFKNAIENDKIVPYLRVKICLAKGDAQEQIALFDADSISYDEETSETSIGLKSCVARWGAELNPFSVSVFGENKWTIMRILSEWSGSAIKPVFTYTIGTNPTIRYAYISAADTTKTVLGNLCQASMSRLVEDANGNFCLAGEHQSASPIVLRPNNILSVEYCGTAYAQNPSIDVTTRQFSRKNILEKTSTITIPTIPEESFDYKAWSDGSESADWAWLNEEAIGLFDQFNLYKNNLDINLNREQYLSNASVEIALGTNVPNVSDAYISVTGIMSSSKYDMRTGECIEDDNEYSASISDDSFSCEIINGNVLRLTQKNDILVRRFAPTGDYVIVTTCKEIQLNIQYAAIEDTNTTTVYAVSAEKSTTKVPSNGLIHNGCFVEIYGVNVDLGQYIVDTIAAYHANGNECFEIECLFADYYFEDGNKAYDSNDLSTHFKKYDVVIPYVLSRGAVVPLRTYKDGTPKEFRILGIRYSYDGLLKQRLYVREEAYNTDYA